MRKVNFFAAIATAALFQTSAQAVVIENKWTAGEKISYDMAVEGKVNMLVPADVPVLWAGIPLEVDVQGRGKTVLQTLAVDQKGTARLVCRVPQLNIKGETLGLKGEVKVEGGLAHIFLNGKPLNLGKTSAEDRARAGRMLSEPPVALLVRRDGKLDGVQPTQDLAKIPQDNQLGQWLKQTSVAQGAIMRMLPAMWPGKDIQEGESWKAQVAWPLPTATEAKPLVDFDLTLKGKESVGGKDLWRVAVVGGMDLDQARLAQVNAIGAAQFPAGVGALTTARQELVGDIWYDEKSGQIDRCELRINSQLAGRAPARGEKPGGDSWTDFVGTLKFQRQNAAS